MILNPLRWYVIRWYEREERELRMTRDPARARDIARERVATGGPWKPSTAERWIEDHEGATRAGSPRAADPDSRSNGRGNLHVRSSFDEHDETRP